MVWAIVAAVIVTAVWLDGKFNAFAKTWDDLEKERLERESERRRNPYRE